MTYTAVTFAPVQGFILASRKLRDLYGSSLLISHLACAQARDAEIMGHLVVSPAEIKGSRGVPNVLVIRGDYGKAQAEAALLACWRQVLTSCREWIQTYFNNQPDLRSSPFNWTSSWKACELHSWEMFHGQGSSIQEARKVLAIGKQQRSWSIPNWTGESSTLSSAEAVVRPTMGAVQDPRTLRPGTIQREARAFLQALCQSRDLGPAFAGAKEEISITELVKRLITYPAIARTALSTTGQPLTEQALQTLLPERLQRLTGMGAAEDAAADKPESIVWFMADGDGIGSHLESLATVRGSEEDALKDFSRSMRTWAAGLYQEVPKKVPRHAMVVYAGGDDLFGALHESIPGEADLNTDHLWSWLEAYQELWSRANQAADANLPPLTVSMGLVWADTSVPQREALQHARLAEASAKARGKNRFALRLVYANGNHLEWSCPWSWLHPIRSHYTDREGRSLKRSHDGKPPSWRHLAEDLHWLQSRQAIAYLPDDSTARAASEASCLATARSLWKAYFPCCELPSEAASDASAFQASFTTPEAGRRFDQWLLDLGRVMAGLEKHRPSRISVGVGP
jgi:CRISPR-associated protein Cmr2